MKVDCWSAWVVGALGLAAGLSGIAHADADVAGSGAKRVTLEAFANDPGPSRLANLSVRAPTRSGDETTILGFVIAPGSTPGGVPNAPVLLRAVGPGLEQFQVENAAGDPRLDLFFGNNPLGGTDDWGTAAQNPEVVEATNRVGAFALADGSADAADTRLLLPGAYTFETTAAPGGEGVALSEVYDTYRDFAFSETVPSVLINGSARVYVGTGEDLAILGFVLAGQGPMRVLIRAVGPTLEEQGVNGVLADPLLWLYAGQRRVVGSDDWGSAADFPLLVEAMEKVGAFPLPDGSKDAALLVDLEPGAYTAQVSGADGGTGVALIEIYLLLPSG